MSTPNTHPSILVVFDQPDDFRDLLHTRFPELRFSFATDAQGVGRELEAARPEVIFSIHSPGLPDEAYRAIVECPTLRWLQVGGSGYERFPAWDTRRVTVTNGVGVLSDFLAETVSGAILALNGGFLRYLAQQRKASWQPWHFRPLSEQTLLIVGVGAIGGALADRAKALGMRVLGVRRSGAAHRSVERMYPPDALPEALGEADIVSLHLRASPRTAHLIDRGAFAAMRPGALFVNTSRGAVVDEQALVEALRSGHLRGAYLDVFEVEPLPLGSPLWGMENVLITPHAADAVHDWPRRFAEFFAANLARWQAGEELHNRVNPD